LPLYLWNVKALEAIGNVLGKFIKVDEEALQAADKKMCKVLVEIDTCRTAGVTGDSVERSPFGTILRLFGYSI
jgi:hypothetical protein